MQTTLAGIRAQTKVRHSEKGIGIVVPDFAPPLCEPGFVMVEFNEGEVVACATGALEEIERIEIIFDHEKCLGCIFADGMSCHRYNAGRYARMVNSKGKTRAPRQIYPDCQQ